MLPQIEQKFKVSGDTKGMSIATGKKEKDKNLLPLLSGQKTVLSETIPLEHLGVDGPVSEC